jgi:hypothetical protein
MIAPLVSIFVIGIATTMSAGWARQVGVLALISLSLISGKAGGATAGYNGDLLAGRPSFVWLRDCCSWVNLEYIAIRTVVGLPKCCISNTSDRVVITETLQHLVSYEYRMNPPPAVVTPVKRRAGDRYSSPWNWVEVPASRVWIYLNKMEVVIWWSLEHSTVRSEVEIDGGLFSWINKLNNEVKWLAGYRHGRYLSCNGRDPSAFREFQGVLGYENAPSANPDKKQRCDGIRCVSLGDEAPKSTDWWISLLLLLIAGAALAPASLAILAIVRHPLRWPLSLALLVSFVWIFGTALGGLLWP